MDWIEHSNSLKHFCRAGIATIAIAAGLGLAHHARAELVADGMPDTLPEAPPSQTVEPIAEPDRNPDADPTRTIYRADIFCQALEPETVELEAGDREAEIEAAIALVLKQWTGSDTGIAGYRVTVGGGVATIDLRRDPDSPRPWLAFSTCEQFALFGSLRETLVREPSWEIESVEFRSLGAPLDF
ncbi:MAG: sporulation/spore germination protein [Geitlerinemataceae cyanobacterium]